MEFFKYPREEWLPRAIGELPEPDKTIILDENPLQDEECGGVVVKYPDETYGIWIRPNQEDESEVATIAHEIEHIYRFMKGDYGSHCEVYKAGFETLRKYRGWKIETGGANFCVSDVLLSIAVRRMEDDESVKELFDNPKKLKEPYVNY